MRHRKRISILTGATLAVLVGMASSASADPCPKDFRYEVTRNFHQKAKGRLDFDTKSKNGRVCVHAVRPGREHVRRELRATCPEGYQTVNPSTTFHSSNAKQRVVFDSRGRFWKTFNKTSNGTTCLAVVKPGTDVGKVWEAPASRSFRRDHPLVGANGMDFRGKHYKAFRSGVSQCSRACAGTAICVAYNYSTQARTCYLYSEESRGKVTRRSRYLGGYRTDKHGVPLKNFNFEVFEEKSNPGCRKGSGHLETKWFPYSSMPSDNARQTFATSACQLACIQKGSCIYFKTSDTNKRLKRWRCDLYEEVPDDKASCDSWGKHKHRKPASQRGGKA